MTLWKYTFNYWHPYASDKFIGVKDSTMNVLEGKKAFTLKSSYKEHAYGYNPSEEVSGNADKKITIPKYWVISFPSIVLVVVSNIAFQFNRLRANIR